MSKVARNAIAWSVLTLVVSIAGLFLATHHHETYNCHKTPEMVTMCDFRYVGNK